MVYPNLLHIQLYLQPTHLFGTLLLVVAHRLATVHFGGDSYWKVLLFYLYHTIFLYFGWLVLGFGVLVGAALVLGLFGG